MIKTVSMRWTTRTDLTVTSKGKSRDEHIQNYTKHYKARICTHLVTRQVSTSPSRRGSGEANPSDIVLPSPFDCPDIFLSFSYHFHPFWSPQRVRKGRVFAAPLIRLLRCFCCSSLRPCMPCFLSSGQLWLRGWLMIHLLSITAGDPGEVVISCPMASLSSLSLHTHTRTHTHAHNINIYYCIYIIIKHTCIIYASSMHTISHIYPIH